MDSTFRQIPPIALQDLKRDLLHGDRVALSRAITLIESKRDDDRKQAGLLIDAILSKTGNSIRIGITGVPGAGKSSFIEVFGTMLTALGKRVAVLSIDPASSKSKGSILGDKTRMETLSKNELAYIRPSSSGTIPGGVASHTCEAILLCEAAGYDVIIVETVGVGQSETMVKEMVDYFLLLMLSGGGDELQGIKRGIMEMADHILINKADGANLEAAKKAAKAYQNAVHLFPAHEAGWTVPVATCSALEKTGIKGVWSKIEAFRQLTAGDWFEQNRRLQDIKWFHALIRSALELNFFGKANIKEAISRKEALISARKISVRKAVQELFDS